MEFSQLQKKIYYLREQQVMLDFDLAAFYDVDVKSLHTAVKVNASRFPSDFVFRLTKKEFQLLKSKGEIASSGYTSLPLAFTEHGAVMLSCALRGKKVVEVSIDIIRSFVLAREQKPVNTEIEKLLIAVSGKYNKSLKEICLIIEAVLKTMDSERANRKGTLAGLKKTYQYELTEKILLRRLR